MMLLCVPKLFLLSAPLSSAAPGGPQQGLRPDPGTADLTEGQRRTNTQMERRRRGYKVARLAGTLIQASN